MANIKTTKGLELTTEIMEYGNSLKTSLHEALGFEILGTIFNKF